MKLKNIYLHFKTISKHKWYVFKFSIRAGIPFRGLMHDLSKFSPTEFFENIRYIEGTSHSPITSTRKVQGYSKAWLHHRGRNKHHPEYWYDRYSRIKAPVMEYKYAVEMICDKLAAGIVYEGKKWDANRHLEYVKKSRDDKYLNEKTYNFVVEIFTQIAENGIKNTITSKNLKRVYKEKCT